MKLLQQGNPLGLLVLAVVAIVGCTGNKSDDQAAASTSKTVSESEKLADFTIPDLQGRSVNLRSYEGQKVVVVNFWATWCGPCRLEIPDFNALYESYKDSGVVFLGVSVDQDAAEVVPPFLKELPIAYPVLLGSPDLQYRYRLRGFPTTFIVDKTGKLRFRFFGMMSREALERELQNVL